MASQRPPPELSWLEHELLQQYRVLSDSQRRALLRILCELAALELESLRHPRHTDLPTGRH